mgnify:CR=1 FL=1
MKDAPLVSIIVACYNVEAYITTCLESLLGQTYTALEVLVVNDGSTDATLSCITTIASRDARVRVFNQTNQGVSASRNFGITMATGDFVLFVDGDDWLSLDTLAVLQPYFYTYDLVCFSYYKEFASIQTVRRSR